MVKQTNKTNSKLLIFVIILGVIIMIFIIKTARKNEPTTNLQQSTSQQGRVYASSLQNFSLGLPPGFSVEEKFTLVILKNDIGEITVSKVGTNFGSLDEYLEDLSVKNHFSIADKENITINSLPAVRLNTDNRLDYFIYATEWTIYTLSTDSEALYDELDQIARSFRYTP